MTYVLLPADLVESIHDAVLNPGELPGRAGGKSVEGALARVENRIAYGMIGDVYDLAAVYAVALARGHCFNDGNKRTAFRVMNAALALNGVHRLWAAEEIGDIIILAAQGRIDEGELALWLRQRC